MSTTPSRLAEWVAFVAEQTAMMPAPQADVVQAFWSAVREDSWLPHVQMVCGSALFAWSRIGKVLDVQIDANGLGEWFCSIESAGIVEGTEDDPERIPTDRIVRRLREHFSAKAPG